MMCLGGMGGLLLQEGGCASMAVVEISVLWGGSFLFFAKGTGGECCSGGGVWATCRVNAWLLPRVIRAVVQHQQCPQAPPPESILSRSHTRALPLYGHYHRWHCCFSTGLSSRSLYTHTHALPLSLSYPRIPPSSRPSSPQSFNHANKATNRCSWRHTTTSCHQSSIKSTLLVLRRP